MVISLPFSQQLYGTVRTKRPLIHISQLNIFTLVLKSNIEILLKHSQQSGTNEKNVGAVGAFHLLFFFYAGQ